LKRSQIARTGVISSLSVSKREPVKEPKRRVRKCKVCRTEFEPRSMTHKVCSPKCAEQLVADDKARKDRQERQIGLQRIKSRAAHAKEAQTAVNALVRWRDRNDGCISCDKPATWPGQWHASHFISVGACATIRFDMANIHKSCSVCNAHLSGNIGAYRPRLVAKIGQSEVDRLEGWHKPYKHSVEELKSIKESARKELARLKKLSD